MTVKQKRNAYPCRTIVLVGITLVSIVIMYTSCVGSSQLNCGSPSGGPKDNPISQRYNDSYAWTSKIKWNCVYNINDFNGRSDQARFEKAENAAFKKGGGIVYLPAGIYQFQEDLILRDSVVIRGAPTKEVNALSEKYAPPTKLIFPAYNPIFSDKGKSNRTAFKKIRSSNTDSFLGLIDLDINRAGIELGISINDAHNQNIIVYGVRSNNVATPISEVPNSFQSPWLRYPNVYDANIKIFSSGNVLVANNRLNDMPTDDFDQADYQVRDDSGNLITYREAWKVPFKYTNHYGISINRLKGNSVFFSPLATPYEEPGLFRSNIVIRDNWIYHTMRAGIHASGDGLVVQDNIIRDQPEKRWYTDKLGLGVPSLDNPKRNPPNITYENRAIDWSGWNVTIKGNDYIVFRHYLSDSQDQSVDGEGILMQECCGGTEVRGVKITENVGNSYIGLYKVPHIENVIIAKNKLMSNVTDTSLIYINADTNKKPHSMNNVRIEENLIDGDIYVRASKGGDNNIVIGNYSLLDNENIIQASCHIQIRNNENFLIEDCLPEK